MNAGMYHEDFSPVGLYVEDGKEIAPLNTADAPGNFFMKPNGVFFVDQGWEGGRAGDGRFRGGETGRRLCHPVGAYVRYRW
jgi:uncharacterized protein YigE (DUF2233 family)